jgi:hypothetical protein
VIAALLLAAASALAPELQEKILAAFAPGDAPRSLAVLLEVRDGAAVLLVLCGEDRAPRPLVARIENGALVGDPVEIGSRLAGRASCGTASASPPFTVRRKGTKPARAVVLSFSESGAPFLAAAISFAPAVLTWTDAKPPERKSLLSPRPGRGDTSFCVLQRNGSWAAVAYSQDAGEYAPSGACVPPATPAGAR